MDNRILFDPEDRDFLLSYEWKISKNNFGDIEYVVTYDLGKIISMHRLLMGLKHGDKLVVDHINHNGLDNRRKNLRLATRSQNCANGRISKNNKTGYKGVSWEAGRGKYSSTVRKNGKTIRIGRYTNLIDAAKAYDKKAKELHGDFAVLNFPKEL